MNYLQFLFSENRPLYTTIGHVEIQAHSHSDSREKTIESVAYLGGGHCAMAPPLAKKKFFLTY